MINSDASNFSIIIQGPFNEKLKPTISNYLKKYSNLEIIIVVWDYDSQKYLEAFNDILEEVSFYFIKDPGGQTSLSGEMLNVNRQLVSTKLGLSKATRSYVIKMRSDTSISIEETIKTYNHFNKKHNNTTFDESILILNLTTINPKKSKRYFAFNDWVYLGLNSDLKKLLKPDLFPNEYLSYKESKTTSLRYNAEQWMVLKGLLGSDFLKLFPESFYDSKQVEEKYYDILKFFIILHPNFIHLKSFKYKMFQFGLWNSFTFKEWMSYYDKDYNFIIDVERIYYNIWKFIFYIKSKI